MKINKIQNIHNSFYPQKQNGAYSLVSNPIKNECENFDYKNVTFGSNKFVDYLYALKDKAKLFTKDAATCCEILNPLYAPNASVVEKKKGKRISPDISDYANTKEFSACFENKIKKMLKDPSKEDIETLVNNVSVKTGADKKEVLEVVSRLTQFSNYSQLNKIGESLQKQKITAVDTTLLDRERYFGINNILEYLRNEKGQVDFYDESENEDGVSSVFIDDMTLDFLENNIGTKKEILSDTNKNLIKLELIDGWNAKVDGFDVSHTMFGSPLSLEDAAVKIIEEKQKTNKSLDDILNGDIIERAKKVFGDNVEINVTKNKQAKPDIDNIVERMKSNYPDKALIEAITDAVLVYEGNIKPESKEWFEARSVLSKYFDNMLSVFSSGTMIDCMKEKYKEIENFVLSKGKTMDEVIYLVPDKDKSFGLITYNYMKTNNIKASQIVMDDGRLEGITKIPNKLHDKVFVILDDVVGSGDSISEDQFYYNAFVNSEKIEGDKNIVFAPISTLEVGKNAVNNVISKKGRTGTDIIIPSKVINYENFEKTLSKKEQNILSKLLKESGYSSGYACTAMPYMIPDNDTSVSGFLLGYMLNNQKANKARILWANYHKSAEDGACKIKNADK